MLNHIEIRYSSLFPSDWDILPLDHWKDGKRCVSAFGYLGYLRYLGYLFGYILLNMGTTYPTHSLYNLD